ncbi:hypothetical protein B566_EDAN002726 [Ephemera danica]|nr:hypothetical protein B566_EDAN002726 [Ephemera danica]
MQFLGQRIHSYTQRTIDSTVDNLRDVLLKGGAFILIGTVVLWISVFIYVAFYYAYMPAVTHSRPVYLQFQPCEPDKGLCSFPSAHVELTKKQQLLKFGQQYRILLDLEMPESPSNKNLGMFMVCIHMRDKEGNLLAHSCRAAMLHYRSELLLTLKTLFFTPLLLLGSNEEKQGITVELFSNYAEDAIRPATDVYLEVQSRHVEVYSAMLHIHAHFTGLRYLMFNWPVMSALVGISSNLFFLGVICALSWCHLTRTPDEDDDFFKDNKEVEDIMFHDADMGQMDPKSEVEDLYEPTLWD